MPKKTPKERDELAEKFAIAAVMYHYGDGNPHATRGEAIAELERAMDGMEVLPRGILYMLRVTADSAYQKGFQDASAG